MGVSEANRKITMELIEEQEELEKNLSFAQIFDSSEDYRSERLLSSSDTAPFAETLMGTFLGSMSFDPEAVAVLKSELQQETTPAEDTLLRGMSANRAQSVMRVWKEYLADPRGDFRAFLESEGSRAFSDHNIEAMVKSFGAAPRAKRSAQPARYGALFGDRETKK